MKYLLMIYLDEDKQPPPEAMPRYMKLADELRAQGAFVLGARLEHSRGAKTVRHGTAVTDGPFAETREQLGGFYLIDVPSAEDAQRIAAKIPAAEWGGIEVRPLMSMP